ncbi:MAG: nucleotidyltransferase domain-containing protein [Candidatus Aureabacteria bacterium]|nr:nucleotidyltransferase domain-containing protein [Candidatus Auribacterota bacterium]
MDKKTKVILNELKDTLEKSVPLESLVLFGSRARNDYDRDSDLDVLVVVDKLTRGIGKIISECAWRVSFKYGVVIVPIAYSRNDWENGPERFSLLALAVEREGVPI